MVTIISSVFADGAWQILATITLAHATYVGPHVLHLPESTTLSQLSTAILALYT